METPIEHIQAAFDVQPDTTSSEQQRHQKDDDASCWIGVHAELPRAIHFVDNGQVILPVKHGKPQKSTQKIFGQDDDDEDMDEVFRIAHKAAMLQAMEEGLVKGDQTFYVAPGRGDFTMKFKGVAVDKYTCKCDDEVGAWCHQFHMKKSCGVAFSTCR